MVFSTVFLWIDNEPEHIEPDAEQKRTGQDSPSLLWLRIEMQRFFTETYEAE